MKLEIWRFLAIFLAIMLSFVLIHNWVEKKYHKEENHNTVTDTIYVRRFKPEKPFKIVEIPKLVMFYGIDTVKVKEVISNTQAIHVTLGNNQVLNYSTQFLAQYPNSDKLVQFTTKNGKLNLTQFNSMGQLVTHVYQFKPEYYDYHYADHQLTSKPKGFFNKFGLTSELMVRPIPEFYDLNLGITHKTSISIYELGLNVHYYPTFKSTLGFSPYIKIRFQI